MNGKTASSSGVLSQVMSFELIRGAVKKDGVGLGWACRTKRCQSTEQEETQAMLRVSTKIQEEKLEANEGLRVSC